MLAFLGLPGGGEWIIILIIALLVFGPRLPAVMRSIGKGVVEFKKGLRDVEDDVDKAVEEQPKKELKG
ncbi:MAG: twin-arginine translocase TatA/TatE family subunit [Planctomycetota bacterium]